MLSVPVAAGSLSHAAPGKKPPVNDRTRALLLSPSGRTLIRQTDWRLDIWHQDPAAGWQHLIGHNRQEGHRFFPQFCLLQPGELVCTAVEDPELSLCVYGPDSKGSLVQKASMPVRTSIKGPDAASPDGLSLLLGSTQDAPIPLQLVPPASQ